MIKEKYDVGFDPLNDPNPIKAHIQGGSKGYTVEVYNEVYNKTEGARGYKVICSAINYLECFGRDDMGRVIQKIQELLG